MQKQFSHVFIFIACTTIFLHGKTVFQLVFLNDLKFFVYFHISFYLRTPFSKKCIKK